jgi:hypothetical protein
MPIEATARRRRRFSSWRRGAYGSSAKKRDMATPADLDLRLFPDAVRQSPDIGLSFSGSGDPPAANGESP